MPKVRAWFDGCCEPKNPGGHASYGYAVYVDDKPYHCGGEYVGHGPKMSNNVAEYAGVIEVLKMLTKIAEPAIIYGDSKLVIKQMSGKWKVGNPKGLYVPYYREAIRVLAAMEHKPEFHWIPREQNDECDKYSKEVMKNKGVKLVLQTH